MDFNQATISSYVGLILMPVLGYFAVSETTSSAVVGVVSAVIFLLIQVWNEKNNSNILTNNDNDTTME
ncbi:hypothetical protein [Methanobrevibacter boviskoreani]|uniref:hypothetical protein n=1 Tax=Methanobrevibacter boviskoreani TaxID=1348249 RepID=UPI0005954E8F|nr:hypothetical protein [Methanobrevibacter boviskoreani]